MNRNQVELRLNELFFAADFPAKLADKMQKEGEVWFGIFNPPFSLRERVSQFLGQSAFIRFGDALEVVINEIIAEAGFEVLPRKIQSNNYRNKANKKLDYDLIFKRGNEAWVGEMKVRDNHDSTKKTGQAEDLERKIIVAQERYPTLTFSGIAFYVDNNVRKNGSGVIAKINHDNEFETHLAYGVELFELLGIDSAEWTEFEEGVKSWTASNEPMMDTYATKIGESSMEIKTLLNNYLRRSRITTAIHQQLISIIDDYEASLR